MVHFTSEITLGNLAIVVTLIGIAIQIGQRLGTLSSTVLQHADMLNQHAKRIDKYEDRLTTISGDLQRIVGRLEATQNRIEQQTGYRPGERG